MVLIQSKISDLGDKYLLFDYVHLQRKYVVYRNQPPFSYINYIYVRFHEIENYVLQWMNDIKYAKSTVWFIVGSFDCVVYSNTRKIRKKIVHLKKKALFCNKFSFYIQFQYELILFLKNNAVIMCCRLTDLMSEIVKFHKLCNFWFMISVLSIVFNHSIVIYNIWRK